MYFGTFCFQFSSIFELRHLHRIVLIKKLSVALKTPQSEQQKQQKHYPKRAPEQMRGTFGLFVRREEGHALCVFYKSEQFFIRML